MDERVKEQLKKQLRETYEEGYAAGSIGTISSVIKTCQIMKQEDRLPPTWDSIIGQMEGFRKQVDKINSESGIPEQITTIEM